MNFYLRRLFFLLVLFFCSISLFAKDCSVGVRCSCGDTLIESKELSYLDTLSYCSGPALFIKEDNIEVSCFNSPISSSNLSFEHSGIIVTGDNVSLSNCSISNYYNGVELVNMSTAMISDINSSYNFASGISIYNSTNIRIYGSELSHNNWDGVFSLDSSGVEIFNSTLTYNTIDGIQVFGSNSGLHIINHSDLRFNYGHGLAPTSCNLLVEQTIAGDGKDVVFIKDVVNTDIDLSSRELSELIICNTSQTSFSNIVISNTNAKNDGVLLVNSQNNTFSTLSLKQVRAGVYFYNSSQNTFEDVQISDSQYGLRFMEGSSYNSFTNVELNSNDILLHASSSPFQSFSGVNIDLKNYILGVEEKDFELAFENSMFISTGEGLFEEDISKSFQQTSSSKLFSLGVFDVFIVGFLLLLLLFIVFLYKRRHQY